MTPRMFGLVGTVHHATTSPRVTLCGLTEVVVSERLFSSEFPSPMCLVCEKHVLAHEWAIKGRRKVHRCRACRHLTYVELHVRCRACGTKCCSHKATDKHNAYSGLCPDCEKKP